jgi:chemotaxis protein methyltransferase CheR
MKIHPELRRIVHFRRLNLNDSVYAAGGPFDLVFCRNVLIYFDPVVRNRVVERLIDSVAPGGHLFLGHSETLSGFSSRVTAVAPTVWVKR